MWRRVLINPATGETCELDPDTYACFLYTTSWFVLYRVSPVPQNILWYVPAPGPFTERLPHARRHD